MNHVGLAQHHVLDKNFYMHMDISVAGVAHQAGTCRFGTDPATSVLDANCKAHELDNLYVVDTSFFPSIGAVNPALTAMANAIRVGEHLAERLRLATCTWPPAPRPTSSTPPGSSRASCWSPSRRPARSSPTPTSTTCRARQYGAMFLPQVVTAIAGALLGAGLARRFGAKRVYLVGLTASLVSMAPARHQHAVHRQPAGRLRAAAARHRLPRRRLRAHRADAQHVHGGVPPRARSTGRCSCSTPCSGSAPRSPRCSWRSSSASASGGACRCCPSVLLAGAAARQPAPAAADRSRAPRPRRRRTPERASRPASGWYAAFARALRHLRDR